MPSYKNADARNLVKHAVVIKPSLYEYPRNSSIPASDELDALESLKVSYAWLGQEIGIN